MSKIEIDVTANTAQAEQALVALTGDVDKLQQKAKKLREENRRDRRLERRDSTTKRGENKQTHGRGSGDAKSAADSFKSAISGITDKLGTFGKNVDQASGKFIDFAAKLSLIGQGLGKLTKVARLSDSVGYARRAVVSDRQLLRYRAGVKRTTENLWGSKDALASFEDRDDLTDAQIIRAGRLQRNIHRLEVLSGGYRQKAIARRNYLHSDAMYGPMNGPINSGQRLNRGLMQWGRGGRVGTPGFSNYRNFGTSFLGINTTRLSGLGNMALGGAGLGLRALGMSGLGAGVTGAGVAAGGLLALAATPAIAFGGSMLHANKKVDQGRGKADELSQIQTRIGQLAKNLSGGTSTAEAFAKEIQNLGVKGVVPVEQLSDGAHRLMLAFKGNQQESSKWLNIIADMSAGTGESVGYFAELITKANQFGTVEFEVFNQLNEKGIPIIEQLKGKFGDTREEIMKAAQEGKITAAEFMKAFEAAHKVSTEGANIAQQQATITGLRQQTQEYQDMEGANYTRGYDAEMMNFERWRNRRAERRSKDAAVIAEGEALGSMLAKVTEGFKRLNEHMSHFGDWLISKIASWTGLTDSQAQVHIADHNLYATSTVLMADGRNNRWKSDEWQNRREALQRDVDNATDDRERAQAAVALANFEDDYWHSAADLSSAMKELETRREYLQSAANNDKFNDETRAEAREALANVDDRLTQMRESLEAAQEREDRLKWAREQLGIQRDQEERGAQFRRDTATTDKEMLEASGFDSLWEVEEEIKSLAQKLRDNQGTAADRARYDELVDLQEAVEEYRRAKQEEAEEARRKAEEEAERARALAERTAREARSREMYLLERQARMTDDPETKFQLELEQTTDKLKALGFSADEASQILSEDRAFEITEREKAMEENRQKMDEINQEIEDNKKTGLNMETNAWGSTGNLYTNFTNPIDKQQLTELEKVNDNLQKEIDALNRLDIRAYAG